MFATPALLHVLWLVPLLTLMQWRAFRRESRAGEALVAEHLRDKLMVSARSSRQWAVFALHMLALTCFVLAAAQPRYDEERRPIPEAGKNVIIAIDTSRSMMADDLSPNRLTRAQLAAKDILDSLQGYRVGLIAFAGRAFLQAPLTTDHAAVSESIDALDAFTVPKGGTKLGDVMREAFDAFENTGSRNHGLILLTDGGDEDPDVQAMLKRARDQQVRIVAIGVGTDVGSLIPDPSPDRVSQYILDDKTNQPVHSRLEDAVLRRLASETGGAYLTLGATAVNTALVRQVTEMLESTETGQRERVKPIERFQWPLGLGLAALVLAMLLRPGLAVRSANPLSVASSAAAAPSATAIAAAAAAAIHAAAAAAVAKASAPSPPASLP